MSVLSTLWDKIKENAIAAIATAAVAAIASIGYFTWGTIVSDVDKYITNTVLADLSESNSPLARKIKLMLSASLVDGRADEVGELTSGDTILSLIEPSHTFLIFVPEGNRVSLYVKVTYLKKATNGPDNGQETTGAEVDLKIQTLYARRLTGQEHYTITNDEFRSIAKALALQGPSGTPNEASALAYINDPVNAPVAVADQGKFKDTYTVTLELSGPSLSNNDVVEIQYMSIVTPYIKFTNN